MRHVPCGKTNRQKDMTNPKVAIAIMATRLKKSSEFYVHNSVDFLEDPSVDGRIMSRKIFRKWDWEISEKPTGPNFKGQAFQGDP